MVSCQIYCFSLQEGGRKRIDAKERMLVDSTRVKSLYDGQTGENVELLVLLSFMSTPPQPNLSGSFFLQQSYASFLL